MKGVFTMYKKTIAVFFCIFLIGVCFVFANADIDNFSVRNGITFGISRKKVKTIETKNGNSKQLKINTKEEMEYWPVSVAGYSGSSVLYKFRKNKLYEIVYKFNEDLEHEPTEKYAKEIAKDLYGTLCDKYGNPDHDGDGSIFYDLCSEELKRQLEYFTIANGKLVLYCEWLMAYNNDFMIIDLYEYGTGFPKIDSFNTVLAYHFIEQSDAEKYMNQKASEQEEKTKQHNSDL